MAYSDTIKYVVGDTKPVITVTVKDSNTAESGFTLDAQNPATWDVISIASSTVKLFLRKAGSTTLSATLTGGSPSSDGTVTFTPATSTFATAGTYEGEIEVTYDDGTVMTIHDLLKFNVRDEFDG